MAPPLRFHLTTICAISALTGAAQMKPPSQAEIDAVFKEFDRPDSPGCSVAIERSGAIVYSKGFGLANLEYHAANTPDTVFHVASVSKQVTAFAIQLLVQDGRLRLDDDVRKYVPELHDFGRVVTVSQLMHHTSGLRDQWDLASFSGWRMDDVITEEDLLGLLFRQRELNFAPGSRYSYCNSGYTLLGLIVKRVSGKSLREFCQERIFAPLGMTSTHFHDDYKEIVPKRATSYYPKEGGGFEAALLSFSNVGATGLFTTVSDFSRWTWNYFNPTVGGQEVRDRMQATSPLKDGHPNPYASGILSGHYRGLRVLEHSGADAGYRSDCLLFPDDDLSIVCFANLGSADPPALARRVADLYLGAKLAPAATPDQGSPIDARIAATYVGIYSFDPARIGNFEIVDGKFQVTFGDPEPIALLGISPAEYRIPGVGRCKFLKVGKSFVCRLTNSEFEESGFQIQKAEEGQDRQRYVGEYYSDELQAFCRVRLAGGELKIICSKDENNLKPIAKDVYCFDSRIAKFERIRNGRAMRVLLSTGRSFNIRFDRTR